MNAWFWWLVSGVKPVDEATETATDEQVLAETNAELARRAARGTFSGRCWWHRVVLGHTQHLTVTDMPPIGPAVWVRCSCERVWTW